MSEREPQRLPIGERTASTMYASPAIGNSIEAPMCHGHDRET
jgi:hypothetical protein